MNTNIPVVRLRTILKRSMEMNKKIIIKSDSTERKMLYKNVKASRKKNIFFFKIYDKIIAKIVNKHMAGHWFYRTTDTPVDFTTRMLIIFRST